jgi:hypothetical protein
MNRALIFTGFRKKQLSVERSSGAYRIAHYLREFNWDIEVIDFISQWELNELQSLIDNRYSKGDLKWIGISATWLVGNPVLKWICDYIRETYPDVIIIAGGHNIFSPEITANYYVKGFGELAAKAILEYEFGNGSKPYGTPFKNGWAIDALHFYPSWTSDDYSIVYEDRDFLESTDVVTLELSRGCRFACKFCNFPVLGVKEDNSVSEESIFNNIKNLYDTWGIKNFALADETLNDRNSKLEKLSRAVQRSNINPNLNAFIRIDLMKSHPEQLELLTSARVWGQFYGIETFNHRAGKVIGKGMDPNIIKELMLNARSYITSNLGLYRGSASFIAGLPYETVDDIADTQKWLSENWIDQNWHTWVLDIPKNDSNNKLSAFGEDFEKYGYSEMTAEEIQAEKTRISVNPIISKLMFPNIAEIDENIYWKNPQGNKFTFTEIAAISNGYNPGEPNCKTGNFNIWSKLSLGFTPEEALAVCVTDPGEEDFVRMRTKVSSYIQKKLSL